MIMPMTMSMLAPMLLIARRGVMIRRMMGFVALLLRLPELLISCKNFGPGNRSCTLYDLVQFATVQPDAPAVRTIVYFYSLPF